MYREGDVVRVTTGKYCEDVTIVSDLGSLPKVRVKHGSGHSAYVENVPRELLHTEPCPRCRESATTVKNALSGSMRH